MTKRRFICLIILVIGISILFIHSNVYANSITDVMNNWSETNTPDEEAMQEYGGKISNLAGTVISCIIYLIFAMTAFTTACDLAYICIPPIRPYLYDGKFGKDSVGSANVDLIGRNEQWTANANMNMARAGQHQSEAQMYAQRAQMQASMGDNLGAQHSMRMANISQDNANRSVRSAQNNIAMQQWSDNWRAEANRNRMESAQRNAEQNANRGGSN